MINPSDKDYRLTKKVKEGITPINPDFVELADWIHDRYQHRPLNILSDTFGTERRPRLNIVFEYPHEVSTFLKSSGNFNPGKQAAIRRHFAALMEKRKSAPNQALLHLFNRALEVEDLMEDLLVVFSAFEPVAKEEINGSIPTTEIEALQQNLGNDQIWQIVPAFSTATIFFYTRKQEEEHERNGSREHFTDQYFQLLKRYDRYGYFKREEFMLLFDSKENFDENYDTNWFYYYR